MPKIEILEDKIVHEGIAYLKGEQREVVPEVRDYFCSQGWATDMEGKVKTATRSTKPVKINPETLKEEQK